MEQIKEGNRIRARTYRERQNNLGQKRRGQHQREDNKSQNNENTGE